MATGGSTLHGVTDNQKRWLVFGIALNKVLVTQICPFVEQEVQKEYSNLQTSHNIHTQSTSRRLKSWPTFLKYENINGNDAYPRLPGGKYDFSKFDCRVTSHVDFAKLYVENHMAKFNAFDEHCDASAVLTLLGKVPVFCHAVQSAAGDVRQARNAWAHCMFSDWDPVNYQQHFYEMEKLVKELGLLPTIERNLLGELKDWETKGTMLCMNATMDPDLLKFVQQHVNTLDTDVVQLTFEVEEDKERVSQALKDISTKLEELEARFVTLEHEQKVMKQAQGEMDTRVVTVEHEQKVMKRKQSETDTGLMTVVREQKLMKQEQSFLTKKMDTLQIDTQVQLKSLQSQQENVQQRVTHVEEQLNSVVENREDCSYEGPANVASQQYHANVSVETASFEADIAFFARRHDSETRQWFFDDFDEWFHDPGDSRAYVLLGDPGVGKSVMAAVLAQRKRKAGHLGAAYFCRHNDGTRNDPRYLLGTVACQLCENNSQYNSIVGGEGGVRNLLGNSKLGFRELFTKLLQEPLGNCNPNQQRKLVIIDALDETQYESREDFLDLIMHRFPLLPKWLVFFITSRPEDSVQFRLKKYNPCVKICAGNSDQHSFYQQHEQDIQTFLTKRIDFCPLPYSVKDMSKKCHGLFLYAHYIVEELRLPVHSGKKLNQLSDLFPGDIDDFFLQNFTRIYRKVGQDLFKKLFGCAIVAPSPLPVSIISYILKREKSNHDEQQVIDAVSQFVVLRTSDQTLTFLHNLIPAWLTDKKKASRKLFIDKKIAVEYLRTIFVEIIASVVNEPQPTCPSIDVDLEDYVSRVAVRFLCQYGERDSLKAVFSYLTRFHFIERRILSGRIEIYHLMEDLKLAASRLPFEEVNKQEILQEILFALESNVLFLLECPHLLHSCIRNTSNAVQEALLIPQTSSPWLEWNVYAFPDAKIADMKCFATSCDQRTVAGAKGRSILFFDASTAETVKGPFQVSNDLIDDIDQLEFSPDGKFIFFGRLEKWFSVERGCIEEFPQFLGKSHNYKWGVFTRDGKSIVVKRDILFNPATCEAKSCLFNLLALWALKEIEESQDGEMTVSFCPQVPCREPGGQIERLLKRLGILKRTRQTPASFVGPSLERERETEWEGENPGSKSEHTVLHDPSCHYCCKLRVLTDSSQESSLATLRQLVVEFYSFIFNYQIWDLQTGMSVLQQVFSHDVQLNPFTYLCHVTCAFSECGLKMKCSGIEKAMSVCNIAAVTVVCYALFGVFLFGRTFELESELKQKQEQEQEQTKVTVRKCLRLRKTELHLELERLRERELELELEQLQERERLRELERKRERELELGLEQLQERERELQWEWWWELLEEREREQEREWERECKLVLECKQLLSTGWFREFHDEAFKFGVCKNIPKGVQDLAHDVDGEICICVSPEMKWIMEAGDSLRLISLQTGNRDRHFIHHGKPEYIISKFTHFSFTNDDRYLVYSCEGSLHALSLQTGAVLTSVTGCNLYYSTRERQVGYLFRSETEETSIFLTNVFSPFKFISVSPVNKSVLGNSVAAMFRSSDTGMSVSSDRVVTLWQTTTVADKVGIAFVSKWPLTASGLENLVLHVKNCFLSPNGKLIAIHNGTEVMLCSLAESKVEFLCSVFESKCEFTVACFAFSADNTVLLFCVQDNGSDLHFYLWDIQNKVVSVSFKPPGILEADCCCLSSNKRELILCGEYQIEIWEYADHNCRLLARLAVEKPYNSVKFSFCFISLDNQFLVCCIADVILVYRLHASDMNSSNINSSKRVVRGHLGRVEFCQFLKVNRYLISYGVDGMVFLWDLSEWKAVGFARIAQGRESIVSMAVSPDEDIAVCFTSSGRVCVLKPCELGSALSSKCLLPPVVGKVTREKTSQQIPVDVTSTTQVLTSIDHDTTESLSSSDSEEGYYLEDLEESD